MKRFHAHSEAMIGVLGAFIRRCSGLKPAVLKATMRSGCSTIRASILAITGRLDGDWTRSPWAASRIGRGLAIIAERLDAPGSRS